MELEEQQEINLRENWLVRKDLPINVISSHNGYDVVDCNLDNGARIFYVVRGKTPVGYVHCYEYSLPAFFGDEVKAVQVNSTYFSPIVRRRGLGTIAYKAIIDTYRRLFSDYTRTPGAEALWKGLKRDPSLTISRYGASRYLAIKN